MKFVPIKMAALALAGLMTAAPGAHASSSLYDFDDNRYTGSYDARQSYCDKHPYAPDCRYDDDYNHVQPKKVYKKKRHSHRCAAYIRAAGKRNLVTAFARNSARFAWKREVRAVHGRDFTKWYNARNAEIICRRHGLLKACVAKATPCKY